MCTELSKISEGYGRWFWWVILYDVGDMARCCLWYLVDASPFQFLIQLTLYCALQLGKFGVPIALFIDQSMNGLPGSMLCAGVSAVSWD